MTTIKDQFRFKRIPTFFEQDTHLEVQDLEIDGVTVLSGDSAIDDVYIVSYLSSPYLSFFSSNGKLLDVDHYLPDNYKDLEFYDIESIILNLRGIEKSTVNSENDYVNLLHTTFGEGRGNLAKGLTKYIGLETDNEIVEKFKVSCAFSGEDDQFHDFLEARFSTFYDFLQAYIRVQQQVQTRYAYITHKGNIIITSLNKRSGIAVFIETHNASGKLLAPSRWNIVRTNDPKELEQILVFRTEDIKRFFENDGDENGIVNDTFRLHDFGNFVELDSLLDNTNNILRINVLNKCYHVLTTDEKIITVLSDEKEVTIINTHTSIVPQRWPKKVVLPESCKWIQADENLMFLFAQNIQNEIIVYDISNDQPEEVSRLGFFKTGFRVTQEGNLIVVNQEGKKLELLKTNVDELLTKQGKENFAKVFSDLSYLFKEKSIFTKTVYAKIVSEETIPKEEQLHSAIEVAKYDFESNIDSMLMQDGIDYDSLLVIKNKISIARNNIREEISAKASQVGINIVGQRLKKTINSIVGEAESKVIQMLETLRSEYIIKEMKSMPESIDELDDPYQYKDIINAVRQFEDELLAMNSDIKSEVFPEFKSIQKTLNTLFSKQITNDENALFIFINEEIKLLEKSISETYDLRELEQLMSTHPAAVELFNMLKQPFILQSFSKEKVLSPVAIQKRLYTAIELRKRELLAIREQKVAEQQAAKMQLVNMIKDSIDHFIQNHTGGFSDMELARNAAYLFLEKDIQKLESSFGDLRTAIELRRKIKLLILEKSKSNLDRLVTLEGKYAYVQNDPNLFIDLEYSDSGFPNWKLELIEKKKDGYLVIYVRDKDLETYRPTTTENLRSNRSFEIFEEEYEAFFVHFDRYVALKDMEMVQALWTISTGEGKAHEFPQFEDDVLEEYLPESDIAKKALRCCLEQEKRNFHEKNRNRLVPQIPLEFIDDTPFFQVKLKEFFIKAKLQLMSGSGIILLTGPPSTGKSAFLKFAASIMNREYFEHASDRWQTKNSLVTAIKFGDHGPYSVPAGFTKAITTSHSLINIEEIKEWPEALRKSLNPFFAGGKIFIAPDGTRYSIGDNILMCAAANLGAMYRQEDEPFTSDFWSRVEVVDFNYASEEVSRTYLSELHKPTKNKLVTMNELVRDYFSMELAPEEPIRKAEFIAQQLIEFIILPKADEAIKKDNLRNHIHEYFKNEISDSSQNFNPEEAVKIALKRLPDLQGYSSREFFDLYDHFVNGRAFHLTKFSRLQSTDPSRYQQLKVTFLCIRYIEGCLRKLRILFYSSAGQTEIEGTNREFIKCIYLLGLMGKLY
ncbi:MAG: AAA family ATPase [Saprospiraceae bacterium]|nr:AAA family ATPase [Saprospiraceae bacterium]